MSKKWWIILIFSIVLITIEIAAYVMKNDDLFNVGFGAILAVLGSSIIFLLNGIWNDKQNLFIRKNLLQELILEIQQNYAFYKNNYEQLKNSRKICNGTFRRKLKEDMPFTGCLDKHFEPEYFKYFNFIDENLKLHKAYTYFVYMVRKHNYTNIYESLLTEINSFVYQFKSFQDAYEQFYKIGDCNKQIRVRNENQILRTYTTKKEIDSYFDKNLNKNKE